MHRRVTYAQDRHMFHIMVHDGVTFLCMAEEARLIYNQYSNRLVMLLVV